MYPSLDMLCNSHVGMEIRAHAVKILVLPVASLPNFTSLIAVDHVSYRHLIIGR